MVHYKKSDIQRCMGATSGSRQRIRRAAGSPAIWLPWRSDMEMLSNGQIIDGAARFVQIWRRRRRGAHARFVQVIDLSPMASVQAEWTRPMIAYRPRSRTHLILAGDELNEHRRAASSGRDRGSHDLAVHSADDSAWSWRPRLSIDGHRGLPAERLMG